MHTTLRIIGQQMKIEPSWNLVRDWVESDLEEKMTEMSRNGHQEVSEKMLVDLLKRTTTVIATFAVKQPDEMDSGQKKKWVLRTGIV